MRKWILSLLLITVPVQADSIVKYGLGVGSSAKNSNTEVKTISIAYQENAFGPIIYQLEGGIWTDSRSDVKRKGSGFGDAGIGFNIDAGNLYCQTVVALAIITDTDSMLGSHFQFNNDLAIGLKDRDGNSIGLNYKHISNAGLVSPNIGRDFIMMRLAIPL